MKPLYQISSPYGVPVNVYPGKDPHDPGGYVFDLEGTAIMAGIYDPEQRKRFVEFVKREGCFQSSMFAEFGGGKPPAIFIPRPRASITPLLPKDAQHDIPLEVWVDRLLDISNWDRRATWLEHTIADNLDSLKVWGLANDLLTRGIQQLLTAALEHLPDAELDCLEAAAWFALSVHDEWRKAGIRWLEPFRSTWLRDWVSARPKYKRFARLCRSVDRDLPLWIAGGGA
jgi:hypothetical protein